MGRLGLLGVIGVGLLLCAHTPAHGQTATGTGVGVSSSKSSSQSTAIGGGNATVNGGNASNSGNVSATGGAGGTGTGGQGGQGGRGGRSAAVAVINTGSGDPNGVSTSRVVQSGGTASTVHTTGHTSVSTTPSVFAPGLSASAVETCLGSISAGASVTGVGATFGTTFVDKECNLRLWSRQLWATGQQAAAIAVSCQSDVVRQAMPDQCQRYAPQATASATPAALQGTAEYSADYSGGRILLTEGRTGKERWCDNYDVNAARCRRWSRP